MRTTKAKKRISISTKFILLISSLIIAASVIFALFFIRDELHHTYQELVDHGQSVASFMAQNSEYGIYTEDKKSLEQIIKGIDIDPYIVYVAILNDKKQYLAHRTKIPQLHVSATVRNKTGYSSAVTSQKFANKENGTNYIDVVTPVVSITKIDSSDLILNSGSYHKPKVIGYVQLGLAQNSVKRRIPQFLYSTLLFTSLFTLLGISFTIILVRRMASPLEHLIRATQDVARGKFDQHIQIRSNDEISDLTVSFNHMISHLQAYKGQVESHAADLSASNQKLLQEIQERRRIESSLVTTKARLQHLLTSSPAVIYSSKPYGDFSFSFISENVKKLLGHEPAEFSDDPKFWIKHIHPDDVPRVLTDLSRIFDHGLEAHEYRFQHRDGYYCWIHDELRLVRNEKGNPVEIVGYWIDITERKVLEEQLLHDAFHDSLTKLPNRALVGDRLEVSLDRFKALTSRNKNYFFAVFFLDIDCFKNINDSLGHMIGDQLLIAIAQRLKKCIRPGNTVARLGGDEFALIIDDVIDIHEVNNIAQRIHSELSKPFKMEEQEIFTTVSIGISLCTDEYHNSEQLLRDADTAMYHAKALGRGRHIIFDKSMHAHAVNLLELETDLRRAVNHNDFCIHYQPIVAIENNRIIGFEALLRWQHPVRGLILPEEFIHLAEENGLILDIGKWVLQQACRKMKSLQEKFPSNPPLRVSINLSGKQFTHHLIEQIKLILQETGLDAASLSLEITESIIMKNADSAASLLSHLRYMNVNLQIDDFGTGYSSLSYLHNFPIDALKIDRSFVRMIGNSKDNREIIRLIIMLAKNLNMEVIAEGVESSGQLEQLKKLKCKFFQGFYFSEPLDSHEVEDFLLQKNDLIGLEDHLFKG